MIFFLLLLLLSNITLISIKDFIKDGDIYILKHAIFSLFSLTAYLYVKDYKNPKKLLSFFNILFVTNFFLMIIVFFTPYKIRATRRWIDLYLISIQPGEILKLTLPIFFSINLYTNKFLQQAGLLATVLFANALLLLQPNLSNAIILFLGILIIFFLNPFLEINRKIWILVLLVLGFISLVRFNLKPYHFERIRGFFNVSDYQKTTAYQTLIVKKLMSYITLTGLTNKEKAEKQFKLLPEKHNDFAFVSLIFNFGKIAGVIIIIIYLLLIITITKNIFTAESKVIKLLLASYTTILTVQIVCSLAINLTILPVAGITLPFLSYGGSSLLTFSIILAILHNKHIYKIRFLYE